MTDRSGCLEWEEKGRIGVLKISGKPSNAISRPNFADIGLIRQWLEREEVAGVIIKGKGRHFSSGANHQEYVKACKDDMESGTREFEKGRAILDYIESVEKPVIAAIDGVCFGAGLEIALACHMRFCSKGAVFCFPEMNLGIIPGLGGIRRLVRIAGRANALELLLSSDTFGAEDAEQMGIVNRVMEEKSAFEPAFEMLQKIIGKGAKPVAYAIRTVNNALTLDFEKAVAEEFRMFKELMLEGNGKV